MEWRGSHHGVAVISPAKTLPTAGGLRSAIVSTIREGGNEADGESANASALGRRPFED